MPHKSETPREGGASRKSCAGHFRDLPTIQSMQTQFVIASFNARPELAAVVADLAFGGGIGQ